MLQTNDFYMRINCREEGTTSRPFNVSGTVRSVHATEEQLPLYIILIQIQSAKCRKKRANKGPKWAGTLIAGYPRLKLAISSGVGTPPPGASRGACDTSSINCFIVTFQSSDRKGGGRRSPGDIFFGGDVGPGIVAFPFSWEIWDFRA